MRQLLDSLKSWKSESDTKCAKTALFASKSRIFENPSFPPNFQISQNQAKAPNLPRQKFRHIFQPRAPSSHITSFSANPIDHPITTKIPFPSLSMASFATLKERSTSGEVHVIVGPMFAGKTTSLLRRIKSEVDSGRNVAMLKSSKDTRYAIDSVVTHDGIKFPCWALPDLLSFRERFGDEAYQKLDVIGIDEAQFFEDLYEFCCKAADEDGKIVIVAGLDGDYLRRSFGSVLHIIPLADTITKLTARCEQCGKRAFFTLRKTQETQTELIGGADLYMPVCRYHYLNSELVTETSKIHVLDSQKPISDSLLEAESSCLV